MFELDLAGTQRLAYPDKALVHDALFLRSAGKAEGLAIIDDDGNETTYAGLRRLARRVAVDILRAVDDPPVVGLLAERSVAAYVSLVLPWQRSLAGSRACSGSSSRARLTFR